MFKQSFIVLVTLSALLFLTVARCEVHQQQEAAIEDAAESAKEAAGSVVDDQEQEQGHSEQQLPGGSLLHKLQPHVEGLMGMARDTSMNFYEQARPLVENIGSDLMKSADNYIQSNPRLRSNIQRVAPHLSNLHGTAMNLVNHGSSMVSGLLSRYGQQGGEMAQKAQAAAGGLGESVNSFASQAGEAAQSAVNQARDTVGNFAAQAQDAAGNFAGQAQNAAGNLVEQAKSVANPAMEQVNNAVNSAATPIMGAVNSVMDNLKQH